MRAYAILIVITKNMQVILDVLPSTWHWKLSAIDVFFASFVANMYMYFGW